MFLTSLSERESIDRDIVTIMLSIIMKISFNDFAVKKIIAPHATHIVIASYALRNFAIFATTYIFTRQKINLYHLVKNDCPFDI